MQIQKQIQAEVFASPVVGWLWGPRTTTALLRSFHSICTPPSRPRSSSICLRRDRGSPDWPASIPVRAAPVVGWLWGLLPPRRALSDSLDRISSFTSSLRHPSARAGIEAHLSGQPPSLIAQRPWWQWLWGPRATTAVPVAFNRSHLLLHVLAASSMTARAGVVACRPRLGSVHPDARMPLCLQRRWWQ
jgi:hypothetical protein